MSEELYWECSLAEMPFADQIKKLVSKNVEEALIDAFANVKAWIDEDEKEVLNLTICGPLDPRNTVEFEDNLHSTCSLERLMREAIQMDGENVLLSFEELVLKLRASIEK